MTQILKAKNDEGSLMIYISAITDDKLVKITFSRKIESLTFSPLEIFELCAILMDKAKEAKYDRS